MVDAKIAWKDLVVASAPEQKLELESILRRYPLEVTVVPDAPNAQLSAGRELIKFDNKTMQVYWMLGFASWRAIGCYAPAICGSLAWGGSLQQWLDADAGLTDVEYEFRTRTVEAKSLLAAPSSGRYAWPNDVPAPGVDPRSLPVRSKRLLIWS